MGHHTGRGWREEGCKEVGNPSLSGEVQKLLRGLDSLVTSPRGWSLEQAWSAGSMASLCCQPWSSHPSAGHTGGLSPICPSPEHLQSTINPLLLWPKTQSSALSPCSPSCSLLWMLFGLLPQQHPPKASHTPFPEPPSIRRGVLTLKDLFCSCKGGNTVFPNTYSLLGISSPGHAKSSASLSSATFLLTASSSASSTGNYFMLSLAGT